MNFDGLRVGGVELVFKKLPISKIWGYPGPNSRARGHRRAPRRVRREARNKERRARRFPPAVLSAARLACPLDMFA